MPRGRPRGSGNHIEKTPTSYYKCDENIEKMANDVLVKYHHDLINCKIAYLWCSKDMKAGGKIAFAKVQKVGPKIKALIDYDFIITISSPVWQNLSENQRLAILSHELCHIMYDENSTGEPKYTVLKHDLEEFIKVVNDFGALFVDIQQMKQALTQPIPMDKVIVKKKEENKPEDVSKKKILVQDQDKLEEA